MKRWHVIFLFIVWMAVAFGFIPISLRRINRQVERQVGALTGGDTLRIENLSIRLWLGISLKNVYYASGPGKAERIRLSVPTVRLSYHLFPLLWGKADVYEITFSKPFADMMLPAQSGSRAATGGFSLPQWPLLMGRIPLELPVNVEVRRLLIEDASCSIFKRPDLKIRVKGLKIDLNATFKNVVSAKGSVRLDSLFAPKEYLLSDLKTDLFLSPGRLEIPDCAFSFYGGRSRIALTLDAAADTVLRASFFLDHLQLSDLLRQAKFDRGKVDGKVNLTMRVRGRDLNPFLWQGDGKFTMKQVDLSDLPFQSTLVTLLFLPKLRHLQFEKISTSLNLSNGRILTPDLQGTGNLMDFTGSGWIGLNLMADEKIRLSLSSELCVRLPPLISQEILLPVSGGRCETGGELHGPLSDLGLDLDKRTRTRAVNAILRKAGGLLQGLFHKL